MEKDREIAKLLNVLHRIARAAGFATWTKAKPDAIKFCVGQYNKVLARLIELEPTITTLFGPLPEEASPQIVRMAAHDLSAYFEDDVPQPEHEHRGFRRCGGPRVFAASAPFRTGHC